MALLDLRPARRLRVVTGSEPGLTHLRSHPVNGYTVYYLRNLLLIEENPIESGLFEQNAKLITKE